MASQVGVRRKALLLYTALHTTAIDLEAAIIEGVECYKSVQVSRTKCVLAHALQRGSKMYGRITIMRMRMSISRDLDTRAQCYVTNGFIIKRTQNSLSHRKIQQTKSFKQGIYTRKERETQI